MAWDHLSECRWQLENDQNTKKGANRHGDQIQYIKMT